MVSQRHEGSLGGGYLLSVSVFQGNGVTIEMVGLGMGMAM